MNSSSSGNIWRFFIRIQSCHIQKFVVRCINSDANFLFLFLFQKYTKILNFIQKNPMTLINKFRFNLTDRLRFFFVCYPFHTLWRLYFKDTFIPVNNKTKNKKPVRTRETYLTYITNESNRTNHTFRRATFNWRTLNSADVV